MSINRREQQAADDAYGAFSDVVEVGAAKVIWLPEVPTVPMLNRVVGLGVERPATEDDVDAALAAVAPGVSYYVAVAPNAEPPQLPDWLHERGLQQGWGWMAFRRSVADPPRIESELALVEVDGTDDVATFAHVVRDGYGMAPTADAALVRLASSWRCWLALDGDEPIGAAGLYLADGVGYLGAGATLANHRGKGAQTALLAARIRQAASLGCDVVVTETGERSGDRPSNSYRNIVRAGFEEVAVTANWQGRA